MTLDSQVWLRQQSASMSRGTEPLPSNTAVISFSPEGEPAFDLTGPHVGLSSGSIAIDRSQCCRAGDTFDSPRRQYGGRSGLKDDPLLLERVSQLSRFGEVGGRHIELQQPDAQTARALLKRFVGQQRAEMSSSLRVVCVTRVRTTAAQLLTSDPL